MCSEETELSTRLDTARRKLGQELGPYGVFTASGGSTTTLHSNALFQSSELPADFQAYVWAYVPTSAQPRLRRIKRDGLDAAAGILTVDGIFGTPVSAGMVFELSSKLPPAREPVANIGEATWLGLNEAANLALRHILVPDDALELALVTNQRDYSLSTWSWLDREDRLVDVRQLDALGTTYVPTPHTWEFREGARGSTLRLLQPFRFSSGAYSVKLDVLRPADTLIKVGGTWGDSTVGLVNESDEAGADLNQIIPVALAFCYRALRDRSRGLSANTYATLYERQVREARRVRNYDHTNDIDPSIPREPATTEEAA